MIFEYMSNSELLILKNHEKMMHLFKLNLTKYSLKIPSNKRV